MGLHHIYPNSLPFNLPHTNKPDCLKYSTTNHPNIQLNATEHKRCPWPVEREIPISSKMQVINLSELYAEHAKSPPFITTSYRPHLDFLFMTSKRWNHYATAPAFLRFELDLGFFWLSGISEGPASASEFDFCFGSPPEARKRSTSFFERSLRFPDGAT